MRPTPWRQANVAFLDWDRAETTALTHLAPLLHAAEDEGALAAWFVIRKRPCWRVRYQPGPGGHDRITRGLDELTSAGHIEGWTPSVYEPEVHAFGGTEAMDSAHRLFHRDSRGFLTAEPRTHRGETSLILCNLLMHSAGLDWYERGDVWARVAAHRAQPETAARDGHDRLHTAVHHLLSADPHYVLRPGGPLAHATQRARAHSDTGAELAGLHAAGRLHRGLRDVLAHHVIFAWNRCGLPYATQTSFAAAAKTVVFGPDPTTERSPAGHVETP
ncbi:thiopeptide-type bacteriocin biosynthesis protein [Kitasatospora sp. NPDC089797]|uniref:thiopeptide-type bacteriocin biosynthesis protein n=1 Tax=Kitasatospora sp. NPDC089797 TaxID=3155298 RepID=UPI003433101D